MKIDLYNQEGKMLEAIEVPKEFFEGEINEGLMHDAYVLQRANGRYAIAHTKGVDEVSGSTKKIYRQKHTGNARHGSRKANLFKGGAITFGPKKNRNFSKRMPKKARRLAMIGALSSRAMEKGIIALDKYDSQAVKTKDFNMMLTKLPESKNYLFVIPSKNEFIEKSARNIPKVKTLLVNYLNIFDLLKYRKIVFLKDAIEKLPEIFSLKSTKKS